jgi:hypothetical protein
MRCITRWARYPIRISHGAKSGFSSRASAQQTKPATILLRRAQRSHNDVDACQIDVATYKDRNGTLVIARI